MKLVTKNTDYAIRALMHLAKRPQEVVAVSEIAGLENIPDKFLKRLMLALRKNKYIVTKEGKGGGVALAKDPKQIFVSEIMRIFQGDFQISECMFKKNICPNRRSCALRCRVKPIEKDLESKFAKISISSLAAAS